MKALVVIAPERYRDEELDEPLALFRERGISYDIASTKKGTCGGMLGGRTQATLTISEADPASYGGIIIIGGAGAPAHLWGDRNLATLVTAFYTERKIVAAICLAPVILAHTGILKGRNATVFRSPDAVAEMKKGGAILSNRAVVEDDNVITANGPAAASAFAQAVISAFGM